MCDADSDSPSHSTAWENILSHVHGLCEKALIVQSCSQKTLAVGKGLDKTHGCREEALVLD